MANISKGASFLSSEIRKNFASFYLFGDLSTTKRDLVGRNDLTYVAGSPSLFYGKDGVGESFDGTKYLVNNSIAAPITTDPVFLYFNIQISTSVSSTFRIMSMGSSSPPGYQIDVVRDVGAGARLYGRVIHSDLVSPNDISTTHVSKNNSFYYSVGVFHVRDDASGTMKLFVNGEKVLVDVYRAISISSGGSIDKVSIGAGLTGANGFVGGIFSAGWGTLDPGDDFFRRLSLNPDGVIFQKPFRRISTSMFTIKQRRTFPPMGMRSGSRRPE